MATAKEQAAVLKAALKAHGITSRQVSIRVRTFGWSSALDVTVRDAALALDIVERIARPFEAIRVDHYGQMLEGLNLYVEVHRAKSDAAPLGLNP